jgi:prepilin-type N-terminal cleavage/methylation domain-containing protein
MKKGLTLIEVLISTALIGTLIAYEVMIFGRYIIINKNNLKQQETERYVDEAFDFIGNEIENCSYLRNEGNCIIIGNNNNEFEDRIELKPVNTLVIRYGDKDGNYSNVIADYIQVFSVYIHGKVMYISITDANGKKYEKCYGIRILK